MRHPFLLKLAMSSQMIRIALAILLCTPTQAFLAPRPTELSLRPLRPKLISRRTLAEAESKNDAAATPETAPASGAVVAARSPPPANDEAVAAGTDLLKPLQWKRVFGLFGGQSVLALLAAGLAWGFTGSPAGALGSGPWLAEGPLKTLMLGAAATVHTQTLMLLLFVPPLLFLLLPLPFSRVPSS